MDKAANDIAMADLVAHTVKRTPAKVGPFALQVLSKLYIGFLENGVVPLVDEVVDWHCQTVDPKEVSVSASFVHVLVSEEALPQQVSLHPQVPLAHSVHQ